MLKKLEALRPLLRGIVLAAAAFAAADVLLLAARHWGGLGVPGPIKDGYASGAISVGLLVIVLWLARRLAQALGRAEAAVRLQQQVFDALQAGVVLFDEHGRIALCNREFTSLYGNLGAAAAPGASYEQLLRAAVTSGMVPDAASSQEEWVQRRLAEFGNSRAGMIRRMHDGSWRRVVERCLPDGGVLALSVDVTELEDQRRALDQARRELARSRQQMVDAIEALPAGFELYDAEDRLLMVNRKNLQMYPQLADLAGQRPTFEQVVRTNAARGGLPLLKTPEQLDDWVRRRLDERRNPPEQALHHVGETCWMRTYERRTQDGGLVAIRLDVSELMQQEAQLRVLNARLAQLNEELSVLSQTDALTGLANRRAFEHRLGEDVARAVRHQIPLSLLLLDIDHFKLYNDHHGHPAGDACLRQVAALLRECAARPTDLVARIGGEEFVVLLPHDDLAAAVQVARRCLAAIEGAAIPHPSSPVAPFVTVSIGVAKWSEASADGGKALLAAADGALYEAKKTGRARIAMSAPA